jgi:cytochrome c oxidase subunit II
MKRRRRRRRRGTNLPFPSAPRQQRLLFAAGLFALIALLLGGCASPSALDPHGYGENQIATQAWIMIILAAIIFVIVIALLLFAVFRRRRGAESALAGRGANIFVTVGGVIIPLLILIFLFGLTLHTMRALSAPAPSGLTINVVGHEWWWEVQYPQQQFTTANEIHIPTGQQVHLKLTTADVIHSFWVPQLQAKEDLLPGHANDLLLEADQPGTYRGQCAEFCGAEHAHMAFFVIADPPDQFAAWVKGQQAPPPQPTAPELQKGYQVFIGSSCSYCHAVRGTNASANVGPDLTHLASRHTLAAGTLDNTPGNLAGWITSAQNIKPDNKMPSIYINGDDLQALLMYLDSLT